MGYGSKTNAEGVEFQADGAAPILTGERIPGNKMISFGFAKDSQSGETLTNRAEVKFQQSNGATFTHNFFSSEEEWAQDKVSRELLHIFSKIVSKDEYYAALPGEDISFESIITAIKDNLFPKAEGKKFTLKIGYRLNKNAGKWYPNFPNFPNFIELDGTNPSTLSTNPKYDFYAIPVETSTEDLGTTAANANELF